MNASDEALVDARARAVQPDLETIFEAQYRPITRAIVSVIQDPGRAEELAVEVFLKWSRHPAAHGAGAKAWLYRAAARMALDELRKQTRRGRYEQLLERFRSAPTPEIVLSAKQREERVRIVLAAIPRRQGRLLLLRSQGLDYSELAAALQLNPVSVGALLARAQHAFRKEFVKRYGEH